MTTRSRFLTRLLCAGLLLLIPGIVLGGANAGGVLILHANPPLVFTNDMQDPCGQAGLDSCAAAITSVAWDPGHTIVFHVLAAFPPESQPRMKGVSFGIGYDPAKFYLQAQKTCADFEVNDNGWPAPGTGTGQSWNDTQTSQLKEVYWFAGYAYSEVDPDSTSFALIPRSADGGIFVDDAAPRMADSIAAFGRLGFGVPGFLPCPGGSQTVDGSEGGGDGSSDGPESDLITQSLAVWINPSDMSFDVGRRTAQPIDQIIFENSSLRDVFIATKAIDIQKEFPSFGPADTLRPDYRGKMIRVPDLSGFFHVRYASATSAQAAIAALLGTPGIGNAELVRLGRFQTSFPDDPYDSTFCKPWCSPSDAQWHLINHGLIPSGTYCDSSQASNDIGLPDEWWIPGNHFSTPPILVGMVDTGLPADHPDLKIAEIPDFLKPDLQSHPTLSWCITHGQRMAGLMAASTNNSEGVAGVCTNCELLDLECCMCSDLECDSHVSEACESVEPSWITHLVNAKESSAFNRMRIANIELAWYGWATTDQVTSLASLYQQGVLITAPMRDYSASFEIPANPANLPFVLGVGGFTNNGRFWDANIGCWDPSLNKGTSVCPGLDICAPANPSMATTDTTGVLIPGSSGPYSWTTGQCSGACAITAGSLGYLMNSFYYYSGDGAVEPTPDDYVGILQLTATPWSEDPRNYSRCTSCPLEDFGRGRLNVGAADYILRGLWCQDAQRSFLFGLSVGWQSPGVSIDSTSAPDYYVAGDTLIREYTVTAPISIPSSGNFGGLAFIAWARPFFWSGGVTDTRTTSCLAYGTRTMPELFSPDERWQLAKRWHLTDCQMSAIDQSTGQAVLTGHNFARIVKNQQGQVTLVDYVVPPSQFAMAYSVVSTLDVSSDVSEPASKNNMPRILALTSPTDGSVRLQYSISTRSQIFVEVFDVAGRLAASLDQGVREPGSHVVTWDRTGRRGEQASAGLYWVHVRGDGMAATRKVVLLK